MSVNLHYNKKTIVASDNASIGDSYTFNGVLYLVVDNDSIKTWGTDILPYTQKIVTTKVTNMDSLFKNKYQFNEDISNWDVSGVTVMTNMFNAARAFNQDIGDWDTSNVTNMKFMFIRASNFNQTIGTWERTTQYNTSTVGQVTDMSFMFSFATNFNSGIGGWDVGKVTTMEDMFNATGIDNEYLNYYKCTFSPMTKTEYYSYWYKYYRRKSRLVFDLFQKPEPIMKIITGEETITGNDLNYILKHWGKDKYTLISSS